MEKMNTKLLMSILMIGVVAVAAGAGTIANFSDTETSTGNTMTAGTMDLTYQLDGGAGVNGGNAQFTDGNKKPGDSGFHIFTLNNPGSLAGSTLAVTVALTNDNDNVITNPEIGAPGEDGTAAGELDDNMDVVLFVDDGAGGGTANNGVQDGTEATLYNGKLNAIGGPYNVAGGLGAGATTYVSMTWSIAGAVGNCIQSDSITVGYTFVLNQ